MGEAFGFGAGKASPGWTAGVPTGVARPFIAGLAVLAVFLLGFGVWAATAPLSGAVVATGLVQANGENLVVTHLEGGIIDEIRVEEGDSVKRGDILVTLQKTQVLAESNRVRTALLLAQAQFERARAELSDRDKLEFSAELQKRAATLGLESELEEQQAEFDSRLQRHHSEQATLNQRIKAVEEEIEGQQIRKESQVKTLEILREEMADKKQLLDQGLTQRSGYNALRRAETDTLGQIGTLTAVVGQKRASIAELEDQLSTLRAKRQETAATQINELRSRISDLSEMLRARNDTLARSEIRAPADGIIVELRANTPGSTIQPGEAVAEILPTRSDLIIEARVLPQDADAVRIGQDARVRLTALNTRTTPELPAQVVYLSADRLVDRATREPYYTARLVLSEDQPSSISSDQIFPGMPVDVFINTGERTFLEYLLRPLLDSVSKAFREE